MAIGVMLCLNGQTSITLGDEPQPTVSLENQQFFENNVRPLLVKHCLECHGEDDPKGGLRLDSRSAILQGGESGEAVDMESPAASLLLSAVRYESLEMPPEKQLAEEEIAVLESWLARGLPWPHVGSLRRTAADVFTDEDRSWWAFQPVSEPPVPFVDNPTWAKNPIDAFLYNQQQAHGLTPAEPADRATLIRRLTYDLIGLPPTPADVEQFVTNPNDQATELLIDRLLNDPGYGQRWAQHWLNLVRYADSDGYRADELRPHAWRYRDYVIQSFNQDKPYWQFVQEQLAADELFPESLEAQYALGFLRHGVYEFNQRDVRGQWNTILNDITDTTGDVFLGMGMQCAKCHDHKYDPILRDDYYRLRAFFEPLLLEDRVNANADQVAAYEKQLTLWEEATAGIREQIATLEAPYRQQASEQAINRFPPDIQTMIRKPYEQRTAFEHQLAELAYRQVDYEYDRISGKIKGDDKKKWDELQAELAKHEQLRPQSLPMAMAISEPNKTPPPTFIPGNEERIIKPGFLSILDEGEATIAGIDGAATTGRRAALAKWLTRDDHPLTARVIVNRVWQYHFGRGLAENPSDLGLLGGAPSHPQLLDWLTAKFIEEGWSLKKLHRRIVTSAAYQQSSVHPQALRYQQIDPENQYYWRWKVQRLDAEQIRDSMLAISGRITLDDGGPGFAEESNRRSIFRRIFRNSPNPLLESFDLPQAFTSEAVRNTTTTPVQALQLINGPQTMQYANELAARLPTNSNNLTGTIDALYRLAYGRQPTDAERQAATDYLFAISKLVEAEQEVERTKIDHLPLSPFASTGKQGIDIKPDSPFLPLKTLGKDGWNLEEFTLETSFIVRSVYDSGTVRTLAAKITDQGPRLGWSIGITGKGSRRRPQLPVIQLWGRRADGSVGEEALFADQEVKLNHPYRLVIRVTPVEQRIVNEDVDTEAKSGTVVFELFDLMKSNSMDNEQSVGVTEVRHELVAFENSTAPLLIAGRKTAAEGVFDGVLHEMQVTNPAESGSVMAHWRFESPTELFIDRSENGHDLIPPSHLSQQASATNQAIVDLCHAILNSNEFLYVD